MHVRGPELFEGLAAVPVHVVARQGDVVGEGVDPHVDDVPGVEVHRDAPRKARARDAEVLQTWLQEVIHHLVLARLGLDELRVRLDIRHELVGVLAHAEEIGLLLRPDDLAPAVRALAAHELALRVEGLVRHAVPALVFALVDVSLLIELAEDLLHLLLVHGVGGAHKAVVARVHQVPDALDLAGDLVDELLGRDALGLGLELDLLAVLVRAGLEIDLVALQPLEAADGVRQHDLIGVADVRLAARVRDGGAQIILAFAFHVYYLPVE